MGYKGLYNPYQYDLFSEENETPAPANGFQLPAEQVAGMSLPGGLQLPAEQRPGAYYTGPPSLLAQGAPGSATSVPYPTDFLNKYYGNNASQGSSNVAIGGCFGGDCFNTELDLSGTGAPQKSSSILAGNQPPGQFPGSISSTNVPSITSSDPNKKDGYGITSSGDYKATLDPTGGYSLPGDVAEGEDAPPEGTFGGYDEDGNRVSINPEKAKDYNEGWRPEGDPNKKCPEGQKWDPKRKQCYKETKGTFEPEANLLISGLRAVGDIIGRREQNAQDRRFADMTLADNIMAPKPGSTFKTRGLYDINTFGIPNAGVYANNYVQPAEQLPSVKKGGDVMYLTDQEILDIINMGGQVEFLD